MAGHRTRALCAAAAVASLSAPARAEDGVGPWVAADEAEVRLVSSVGAVAPGAARVPLGLHLRIAEGWRIYWRTPGAAGLPPQLDWSESVNLAGTVVAWPAPRRFEAFGQQSYGYAGEVIFPVTATLLRPGEPLGLRLALAYLICREVCMPGEASLALDLAAGKPGETSAAAAIARHAARVPASAAEKGVAIAARSGPGGLTVTVRTPEPLAAPDLFLEWPLAAGQRRPDLPKPAVTLSGDGREAEFRLSVHAPLVRPGTRLTVTVTDGAADAVEAAVTVEPAGP
jgi:suppressor for copper-sensitivity B